MFTFIEDTNIRESMKAGSVSVIITLFYLYFFRPNYVMISSQTPELTVVFNTGLAINIALFVGCVVSLIVISSTFVSDTKKSENSIMIQGKFI